MIRFGIVLALCHIAFAGIPYSGPYLSKNSIYPGQQQQQKYDSAKYPGQQYFASNRSQYENTALLASKFSHLTKTWVAGSNPLPPSAYIGGVLLEGLKESRLSQGIFIRDGDDDLVLPQSFDARQRWPECPSLNVVRNQGCCGSCWAVSAAAAMTDRWCIHSKGKDQFTFGGHDLLSCCHNCGRGCLGGWLGPAWQYWVEQGISSGGPYNSQQGCHPYPIDVCSSGDEEVPTPKCLKKCRSGYNLPDAFQDRHYGRVAYSLPTEEEKIMEEIYRNGPVQASYRLYLDFMAYKSGVYRHTWGPLQGGHAVVILGWGEENGVKYWLCKNQWGAEWGDRGFFKIVRGENHLAFEEDVHAGLPSYKRDPSGYY
uniref:Putative cathepsin b n=1 Tax=Psorophora albipes TaxID=869069 RepID=T1D476_9DIPT